MRGIKNFEVVDGICGRRNLAAAVLSYAMRDLDGVAWLAGRGVDMRWWCDVAGVDADHLVERLTRAGATAE